MTVSVVWQIGISAVMPGEVLIVPLNIRETKHVTYDNTLYVPQSNNVLTGGACTQLASRLNTD